MQHVWQIILLNGIEGGFSAIAYVGAHFILGSWYKKSELGTRAAIFCSSGHIGSMAGGWIQAALLKNLDGKAGMPAWRWIFIVVGVLTIPSALFGELSPSPSLDTSRLDRRFSERYADIHRLGFHSEYAE
jgi:MFS transporter, ACS family, pantothenate transporter